MVVVTRKKGRIKRKKGRIKRKKGRIKRRDHKGTLVPLIT